MESSIRTLRLGDREFILVGTAHVSHSSVQDVEEAIEEHQPDRVCVEMDQARYKASSEGQSWQNLNIYRVLKEKRGFLLLSNLVLASFQRRIGLDVGVTPGAEMLAAVKQAKERGIPFSLCDRDIQITLRRAWRLSSLWGRSKLLSALLGSAFSREKIDEEQIEALKNQSALESMMEELAAYLPKAKEVLIDERDRYLAASIFRQKGSRILAVVGAGHMPGIVRILEELNAGGDTIDLGTINSVPPSSVVVRAIPWLVPVAVASLIAWGFVRAGWDGGFSMLIRWVLVNGTLSAAGAIVALAHPLTVVVSFLAAPITSMNPTIGVGIVVGLLEAVLRKPRVIDFERLTEDIATVRGFFRNRLTHVLLVFFFSTIGSAVGTFIALPFLFPN